MKLDRRTVLALLGALTGVAALVLSLAAISAATHSPVGPERPKVTDWMQAWGSVLGVVAGLAAAGAATALLLHERKAADEARRQLAEERAANSQKESKASIEVRSEQYRKIRGDRVDEQQRFVIKNHGPAEAQSVAVTFFRNGEPVELHLMGVNHRTSTPLLHPGEELHMNYILMWNETPPERVVVAWRDGRSEDQSQEFYPTHRDL
ncbi:hypothetical protein F8280_18820 [Micromonospora noduli]|uniref:hypothetical protein n=1 Tax=Micromonospora noduli TaxID=709876 RepID=UPI00124B1C8C|nr:hypothetical protein [Micromonospora noduli]KAB1922510.1 hypothetical protein F8280_18820 [Micromonospora noduli]